MDHSFQLRISVDQIGYYTSWITLASANLPKGEKLPSVHSKVCIFIWWLELGFKYKLPCEIL